MRLRETRIEINADALLDNYQILKTVTQKTVFPVVKANAYGHGDVEISRLLEETDTPFLCVSSFEEADYLYRQGIQKDILIFGYVAPDVIQVYHQPQFVYTIPSLAWYEALRTLDLEVRVHLEINSGMNRVGIKELETVQRILQEYPVEGIYTHFQSPDNLEKSQIQETHFNEMMTRLQPDVKWLHFGNAPVAILQDNPWINSARLGLALYGYRVDITGLKPVLRLLSEVVHVDSLKKGESLGYDYTFVADQDMRFATIPLGYGDGFDVRNTSVPVSIHGQSFPIIGKICMDQLMIAVDDTVEIGDLVVLFGPERSLPVVSATTGIMIYILLTSLASRVLREYYRKGQCYATVWREERQVIENAIK